MLNFIDFILHHITANGIDPDQFAGKTPAWFELNQWI